MTNDKIIIISTGQSRKATSWHPQTLMWSNFIQKLSVPVKTSESYDDYIHLPKSQQDDLKDVGGFVGGTLKDNRRSSTSVIDRHIVTLDADSIPARETQTLIRMCFCDLLNQKALKCHTKTAHYFTVRQTCVGRRV